MKFKYYFREHQSYLTSIECDTQIIFQEGQTIKLDYRPNPFIIIKIEPIKICSYSIETNIIVKDVNKVERIKES